uniref:Uncharacterized protein n=1 Tax=Rhizophora mucronata TaxID=61149 RepID=A0A2P2QXC1_RHIMU
MCPPHQKHCIRNLTAAPLVLCNQRELLASSK